MSMNENENEIEIDDQVEADAPEEEAEEPRVYTQAEIDASVKKALTKARRQMEAEFIQSQPPAVPGLPSPPDPTRFNNTSDYSDALAEYKLFVREATQSYHATVSAYREREETARDKFDDFEEVAYDKSLPVTDTMAQAIQTADNGPDVLYYLGQNPDEAKRISKLSPALQAKEIGKLEAKLEHNPPQYRGPAVDAEDGDTTTTRRSAVAAPAKKQYATTDARSIETMSTSEWIAAERARQMKALEAKMKGRR